MFVETLPVVSGVVYMFAALAVLIASAGKVRIAQKSRSIAAMTTLAWLLPLHYLFISRKTGNYMVVVRLGRIRSGYCGDLLRR